MSTRCCKQCEPTHAIGGAPEMICDCECHTPPPTHEDWKKRFDNNFNWDKGVYVFPEEGLKKFIAAEIQTAIQEKLSTIAEEVQGMKEVIVCDCGTTNAVLENLKAAITNKE